MLLLIFTYMIWLFRDLKINVKYEKIKKLNLLVDFTLFTGIFGIILLFLTIGSLIPWFDYYIVNQSQEPYILFGIEIPTLYTKILSSMLSILVILYLTMYIETRKINSEIKDRIK